MYIRYGAVKVKGLRFKFNKFIFTIRISTKFRYEIPKKVVFGSVFANYRKHFQYTLFAFGIRFLTTYQTKTDFFSVKVYVLLVECILGYCNPYLYFRS